MGFEVIAGHQPDTVIHHAYTEDNKVVLCSAQPKAYFSDRALHYGYGLNPPCNVTDGEGRPLPVFGPVSITAPRATPPFVKHISGSELVSVHDIETAPLPPRRSGKRWSMIHSEFNFISVNPEFAASPKDTAKYFRCEIQCSEPMRLAVLFGYDGPVKMWIDGKVTQLDPRGKNPAIPDDKSIPFRASKGKHEIVVALSANNGNAWGIYLRFERLDISQSDLKKGKPYTLPEVTQH
jgi:sialate O-acetylesterase